MRAGLRNNIQSALCIHGGVCSWGFNEQPIKTIPGGGVSNVAAAVCSVVSSTVVESVLHKYRLLFLVIIPQTMQCDNNLHSILLP